MYSRWLSLVFLLLSCDFTSPVLREIEEAQKLVYEKRYEEAIVKYEKVLGKSLPRKIRIRIYYQLGDLYSIYLSRNKDAISYYEKIKKNSPDPLWLVKTEERMGEIHFSFLKNYYKSYEHYNRLANFTPRLEKHELYEFRCSLSLFNMGNLDQADKLFKKISTNGKHKYHVSSIYYLGLIQFQKEQWKKAIGYWKKYIQREQNQDNVVQTKFLMANAYETMEELKKAYNLYYSILGKYPNVNVVKNRLKSIYQRRVARKR